MVNDFENIYLSLLDHGTPEDPGSVLNFLHDVNVKQESMGKVLELNYINN